MRIDYKLLCIILAALLLLVLAWAIIASVYLKRAMQKWKEARCRVKQLRREKQRTSSRRCFDRLQQEEGEKVQYLILTEETPWVPPELPGEGDAADEGD